MLSAHTTSVLQFSDELPGVPAREEELPDVRYAFETRSLYCLALALHDLDLPLRDPSCQLADVLLRLGDRVDDDKAQDAESIADDFKVVLERRA